MSLVVHFLTQIRQQVRNQQGDLLVAWLQVAPEAGAQYHELATQLRSQYRRDGLDSLIDKCLPLDEDVPDGQVSSWSGLNAFIKDYLSFWRDVDYQDLLTAHELLNALVK